MEDFEQWLNSSKTQLEDSVYGLFYDSLKCFKNDIDRPAYLLAYQGMMMHIKYVILKGKQPECFEEAEWNDILKRTSNDTGWDEEVFNRVKQESSPKKNKQVICIPHEVRTKFDYWRDIRNVCAHYKEYKFIKAHTLTLYSFITQYLLRMTIEGGKESLLEEFSIYFNPIYTSPSEPIKPYIDKILTMVRKDELNSFFDELIKNTPSARRGHLLVDLYNTSQLKEFIIDFVRQEKNNLCQVYLIYTKPKRVIDILKNDRSTVREFWKSKLIEYPNKMPILCQLLESGKIHKDDIKEAMNDYLSLAYKYRDDFSNLSEDEIKILKSNGFFDSFFSLYFNKEYTSKKFEEINSRCNFYISIIKIIGLTDIVVTHIIDVFSSRNYPYTLLFNIKDNILDNGLNQRSFFEEQCKKLQLDVPACLKKNNN